MQGIGVAILVISTTNINTFCFTVFTHNNPYFSKTFLNYGWSQSEVGWFGNVSVSDHKEVSPSPLSPKPGEIIALGDHAIYIKFLHPDPHEKHKIILYL